MHASSAQGRHFNSATVHEGIQKELKGEMVLFFSMLC